MGAFSILLADGHPIFRLGLRAVLGSHENWKICGEADDGQDAIEKCIHVKPDLILLEICLPRLNGVDGVRQILKHNPAQRILILTNVDSEKVVRDCLQAGVRGWVLKSDGIEDLTAAVEALQEPNYVGAKTPPMLVDGRWKGNQGLSPLETPQLSPREREVLQCLAEGRRLKDVAANLNISVKTADTHRTSIMSKLNLHSSSRLVIYALRNEIIQMPVHSVASRPEPAESFSQYCPSRDQTELPAT
jgi:DNA-binding NarL/FixJ family response regulator